MVYPMGKGKSVMISAVGTHLNWIPLVFCVIVNFLSKSVSTAAILSVPQGTLHGFTNSTILFPVIQVKVEGAGRRDGGSEIVSCCGRNVTSLTFLECSFGEDGACLSMLDCLDNETNQTELNERDPRRESGCAQYRGVGRVLRETFVNLNNGPDSSEECLWMNRTWRYRNAVGIIGCISNWKYRTTDRMFPGADDKAQLESQNLSSTWIHIVFKRYEEELTPSPNVTLYLNESVKARCLKSNLPTADMKFSVIKLGGAIKEIQSILSVSGIEYHEREATFKVRKEVIGLICSTTIKSSGGKIEVITKINHKIPFPPIVEQPLTSKTLVFLYGDEGKSLSCHATGGPPPLFRWLLNKKEIHIFQQPFKINTVYNHTDNYTNSTLLLSSITLAMEGRYECIATNVAGISQLEFDLRVLTEKPRILEETDTTTKIFLFQNDESNKSISCSSFGIPRPRLNWIHNDQMVSKAVTEDVGQNESRSTIHWDKTYQRLEGNYTCVAENVFGTDNRRFTIKISAGSSARSQRNPELVYGLSISSGVIVLLCICGSIVYWIKYSKAKRDLRDLTQQEVDEFHKGDPALLASANDNLENIQDATARPFNPRHEVAIDDLEIEGSRTLGEGQFGMVVGGKLKGVEVAVKSTKKNAQIGYFKALLDELKIMAYVGTHENVVAFLGAVTTRIQERIVYIIVEFSPLGDLESFLRKNRENFVSVREGTTEGLEVGYQNVETKMTTRNLVNWSQQIASGMAYLGSRKVLHGDLATRNILMFPDDVVKITDFGLSRMLHNYEKYIKKSKTPVPWRWLAYETLVYREFSVMSDVWSFGVTVWEIFELGKLPYPTHQWNADFTRKLADGMRLGKPNLCPADVYEVMLSCWNRRPESRMCFENLRSFFLGILDQFPQVPVTAISNYENSCSSKSESQVPQVSLHK